MFSNASAQLFPDDTLSSFTKFLPEQLNLEGQWEVAILEISYPSMYQIVKEGKFMSFDKKNSKWSEFYYLEPGLYPPIMDIVEAMNTVIQERHNHSKSVSKNSYNRYKYNHKLTQLVTTLNSRRNCSIDLILKDVRNSDFLSILYSKPLREFRKPQFKIGDRVRISRWHQENSKSWDSPYK